jgi:hypothetical protein
MGKFAIRLLTPASYAAALVVVPAVTPAKATTSSSKHLKHKKHWGLASAIPGLSSGVARYQGFGAACPATSEASTVGCGLLQSMTILTEKFRLLMATRP